MDNEYHRKYQIERYYRHRAILIEELGGKCIKCASNEDLEFDHIDRITKSFDIGKNFNRSLDYLRPEAAKCQLLCKNHHKSKTKEYKDYLGPTNMPQPKSEWKHGTHYTVYSRKCKCNLCLLYAEERNRVRREKRHQQYKPRPQTKEWIHGTYACYKKEIRAKVIPCDLCREANRLYGKKLLLPTELLGSNHSCLYVPLPTSA